MYNSHELYVAELQEYKDILFNKPEGQPGRWYLKKRGIEPETAKYWEIGYCPVNYVPSILKGKVQRSKLHGRIIFPVYDTKGKIVTLSGRKVFDSLGIKYDMYPFNARKIPFGLWQNRNDIREQNRAIITEGQLDVITAWQADLKIVTSTFGAHCSLWHLGNVARYAKNVNILFDPDKAGQEGEEGIRNLSTLGDLTIGFNSKLFEKGEDLDSWIQKHSANELLELLDNNKINNLRDKLKRMENRIK